MNNDIEFLNREWRTRYTLTNFDDHFLDCIICIPQLFFRRKYVWFPAHLYDPVIPNSSGQLAELIVYIIPPE